MGYGRGLWNVPSEELAAKIGAARSMGEALKSMGYPLTGEYYRILKGRIDIEGLSTSHMSHGTRQYRTVKKPRGQVRYPLGELLVEHSPGSHGNIKKRILEEELLDNCCSLCGNQAMWMGEPLVLRLDHKNGTGDDFRIENLRMVCPNCDSQLPTYAGRNRCVNIGGKQHAAGPRHCVEDGCTVVVSRRAKRCRRHANLHSAHQKVVLFGGMKPDKDTLLVLLAEKGTKGTAEHCRVGSDTIRRWKVEAGMSA